MQDYTKMKVAFVHDYLNQYGGAEKVLESLLDIFPNAPIYTGIYIPENVSEKIRSRTVITAGDVTNKVLATLPKYLTFLMPFVFENFDLREYDLIISDGTAWPKGVLTTTDQIHIAYIHTPPRFLYGYSVESDQRNAWYFKPIVSIIDGWLRVWDYQAAQRPDYITCNSFEVAQRIKKFYKRDATVIYPPVETQVLKPQNIVKEDYYLFIGRLAAYKNTDKLINAFKELNLKLKISGTGKEEQKLKELAKDAKNIEFMGRTSSQEKNDLLYSCLGLINPVVDEDFGIVPLEAMAYGKPVLAHRSGGHKETVKEGLNGMFFDNLETSELKKSILDFDKQIRNSKYNPQEIKNSIKRFDNRVFKESFIKYIQTAVSKQVLK